MPTTKQSNPASKMHSFNFTEEDELRARQAVEAANRFMKKIGRGSSPYMVDLSHYANDRHPHYYAQAR